MQENLINGVNWCVNNRDLLLTIGLGIVTISSAIVKVTPNKTDNKVVEFILNIADILSIANIDRNKASQYEETIKKLKEQVKTENIDIKKEQ